MVTQSLRLELNLVKEKIPIAPEASGRQAQNRKAAGKGKQRTGGQEFFRKKTLPQHANTFGLSSGEGCGGSSSLVVTQPFFASVYKKIFLRCSAKTAGFSSLLVCGANTLRFCF